MKKVFLFLFLLPAFCLAAEEKSKMMTLMDVLQKVESENPKVNSAKFRAAASEQEVRMAHAKYLPSVDAAAIAVDGDPGAFALLNVDGNISAADRMGVGGALILKQEIWDFGRTGNEVESAKARAESESKKQGLAKTEADLQALQTYFECAYLRSQVEDSQVIAREAKYVSEEVNKYVKSGQRSIVERYLIDAQTEAAETQVAEFKQRQQVLQTRLAIEMNLAGGDKPLCLNLDEKMQEKEIAVLENGKGENPLLDVKRAQVKAAEFQVEKAKSDQRPELLALATGGYFQNDKLSQKWNYSAGIGIRLPLFEGFKTEADIQRAAAELQAEQATLQAVDQSVNESNTRYDEQIHALKVRLAYLQRENKLAHEAYELAKSRYFGFQGSLVDLREALRNLERVLTDINKAQRDLFIARGGRAIFNGVRHEDSRG